MMVNRKGNKSHRIPVHFVDNDTVSNDETRDEQAIEARSGEGDLSPEEIGRGSSYEDETEVQRRIDRGPEQDNAGGKGRADDSDVAGGPPPDEVPERR
ncbi:MAG TPA: hypothetical protein VEV81_01870, partial [Pyrinomonadaceae bacterium]|nr:hypothetical protein [Pyrinomonadaceae bacterium]